MAPEESAPAATGSRLGRFIQTYHSFLSSFVIGVAGLVATTIWQFRQAEIARREAESGEGIARTQADHDRKIARAEICRDDKLSERSTAIAELLRDELEAANQLGSDPRQGPLALLVEENEVQRNAPKLSWLFEPYLQGLYEHRRWKDIERFESFSPGARLVGALTFATARTG